LVARARRRYSVASGGSGGEGGDGDGAEGGVGEGGAWSGGSSGARAGWARVGRETGRKGKGPGDDDLSVAGSSGGSGSHGTTQRVVTTRASSGLARVVWWMCGCV
jgi:hypothetical protein